MDWLGELFKIVVLPPAGLVALAILGCAMRGRWPQLGRMMVWGSLLLLYLLGTPFISTLLLRSLQWFPTLTTSQAGQAGANAIVILSRDANSEAPEYAGSIPGPLTLERLEYGARLARD